MCVRYITVVYSTCSLQLPMEVQLLLGLRLGCVTECSIIIQHNNNIMIVIVEYISLFSQLMLYKIMQMV